MKALRVVRPGLRTTVEDLGRRGTAVWGVPRGGAFDANALTAANLLLGNRADLAGLEMTLRAPELEAIGDLDLAYVGVSFDLEVVHHGATRRIEPGTAFGLESGARLRGGYSTLGARGWLAIGGGVAVVPVLGSRSTELSARFGGFEGRPLAAGDVIPIGDVPGTAHAARHADLVSLDVQPLTLRVLPGPQLRAMPSGFRESFEAIVFEVARASDRTGVRLSPISGPDLPTGWPPEIEPEGAVAGCVQLPPDGAPIVLGVDGPATGGYAKPAVVIRADLGLVARLAPSMSVRFRYVTRGEAVAASARNAARLAELRSRVALTSRA
ncbi:MAG TPA: biotin-dependent carboxyltransferase family protein [Thermoanaerobaculia bacterium]|nr:biotin-dependent carboxyltransferase family protein [Thermoanaerobaculia bacterium]